VCACLLGCGYQWVCGFLNCPLCSPRDLHDPESSRRYALLLTWSDLCRDHAPCRYRSGSVLALHQNCGHVGLDQECGYQDGGGNQNSGVLLVMAQCLTSQALQDADDGYPVVQLRSLGKSLAQMDGVQHRVENPQDYQGHGER
jgi:hypothetical protein